MGKYSLKIVLAVFSLSLFFVILLGHYIQEIKTATLILTAPLLLILTGVFLSKMKLESLFRFLLSYFSVTCLILLVNEYIHTWVSLHIVWLAGNVLILALLLYIRGVFRKSIKN